MSLRKRLVIGIGLILLILGISKPLTEAAFQALKPQAIKMSGVETNGSCKPNCKNNGKLLNIPFLSWLPKKQTKNDEDLRVWDTNEKPKKQKDLKPKKNKLIVVGVENAKRGMNEKGESSSSMLLMSLIVLPLFIISYIVWRKRRKTKKQDEDSIRTDTPLQSLDNDFVIKENSIELPDAWIRKQLIQFNQILPTRLRRHDTETLQEWCLRIGFQPSHVLIKAYLLERYTDRATTISEMDKQTIQGEFGAFVHQFD
ncbi:MULTISPECIES: hypothetical protein [unclassified Exiguobacterium]|uniref:hypothetical protein n=1 Tax=unclassified Exiguobacterium TaxID=2644629 RepID=UPI00044F95F9|nr:MULTISPECIES: hypothetical protein [unclassified Exiguobacterium]EZP58970.1 hypothetical protein BW42_02643 [Exiguobacterium sp. RIT341]